MVKTLGSSNTYQIYEILTKSAEEPADFLSRLKSDATLSRRVQQDAYALTSVAHRKNIARLKNELSDYLTAPMDKQANGSVSLNQFGSRYNSIIHYIDRLSEIGHIDSAKLNEIKSAIIKVLEGKIGYRARPFIAKSDMPLYKMVIGA